MLLGSYSGDRSQPDQNRATITLNVTETLFDLPVVGGKDALSRAGLEKATPADVVTPADEPVSEPGERDLRDGSTDARVEISAFEVRRGGCRVAPDRRARVLRSQRPSPRFVEATQ